ncbi:MAG TPA: flagellar basal body P-ring protein FlgI [Isosphaeraceae bacterium]|jgi:flagellar basal body P-ring protein FlgI|nr:flagellar basal body P-ring protein FlgI [Isosphaeraceae bacterium]
MRRFHARSAVALVALVMLAALGGAGWGAKRKPNAPPIKPLKVDETIGDLALISSTGEVPIEGVGLVTGLDGTGSNPEPSYYRQRLLDDMRKAGVEGADKLLANPAKNMSLVIVRARIPSGTTTQDRIDVTVELTGNSTTTSLAGGWLVACRMREVLVAKGEAHEGTPLAVAGGPVMVGSTAKPSDLKVGRVLGGGKVKKDMPFSMFIDTGHRSIRTSKRLESVINERFHQHEGTDQKGMATATRDYALTLKVPKVYHHNQARYFQVVKLLPVVSDPTLQAQRLQKWGKELLDPKTAGIAALRLEGIGPNAAEVMKQGLESANPMVKFLAAEALAYVNDPTGVEVLADTAIRQPKFRAFALAALAAMDQSAATLRLRRLMDESDVAVRYGAFNALRTQDEHDPFLGQVQVLEDEPDDPERDQLAVAIAIAGRRRRNHVEDPFSLYVVDSEGPPLVHVTATRRCEIVVFGQGQKLLTPVVLGGTGSILLNAADGDEQVQISRILATKLDGADRKVAAPLSLGEVIRETAQLGATYPEIVGILQAAEKQKNLPGPLVVDAVPKPQPEYDDALLRGIDPSAKKDDALQKTNLEKEKTAAKPKRRSLRDRLFSSSPKKD